MAVSKTSTAKKSVLFVGQIPPPWTGQGVIHQMLLEGKYQDVNLVPTVMRFSKSSADQGSISFRKIWSLFRLISKTYRARLFGGVAFLYFSPGGPAFSAVFRDAIYLYSVRPIMRRTMLVYHSSGVAQYVENSHALLRPLLRGAFLGVEIAVQLSPSAPPDGHALRAEEVIIIPNAVRDDAGGWFPRKRDRVLRILFMGIVTAEKGVKDLLEACRILAERQIGFELTIAGSFASSSEEKQLRAQAEDLPPGSVSFAGPLAGSSKLQALRSANVFCFPSFWHKETFPLVLLEALSFGLPVVASRWRGIPDLVGNEEECGLLVDVHAIDQISAALEALALDPDRRQKLSEGARLRYERLFTTRPFMEAYSVAFSKLVRGRIEPPQQMSARADALNELPSGSNALVESLSQVSQSR
jgi:glycosyltransferase involved in cell wall biosynthesis